MGGLGGAWWVNGCVGDGWPGDVCGRVVGSGRSPSRAWSCVCVPVLSHGRVGLHVSGHVLRKIAD